MEILGERIFYHTKKFREQFLETYHVFKKVYFEIFHKINI